MTKYSGAAWIQNLDPKNSLSPLAVKTSNVLGQVYAGIYHIGRIDSQSKKLHSIQDSYTFTVLDGMATTDSNYLTRLFLCCQMAGLDISIDSGISGILRLTFKDSNRSQSPTRSPEIPQADCLDFYSLLSLETPTWIDEIDLAHHVQYKFPRNSSFLYSIHDDSRISVGIKSSTVSMERLKEIISRAHSTGCRAEIQGRNHKSLGVIWSKRDPESKSIVKGHPTSEEAIEKLKPLWDIDYTSRI